MNLRSSDMFLVISVCPCIYNIMDHITSRAHDKWRHQEFIHIHNFKFKQILHLNQKRRHLVSAFLLKFRFHRSLKLFSDAYLTNIWRLEDGINKRFDERIKSTKTLPNSHQANVYLWSMLSFLTRFWFVWKVFAVVFQLAQRTKFKQFHKRCILLSQKHKLFRSFVLFVWAFLRSSLSLESNNPDTSGLASKTFTSWEH